eukprot:m.48602 g.48602  ORF g.48602 m.48602 type:complete len:357 (-) comp12740_c0_seq2:624-1694(-)
MCPQMSRILNATICKTNHIPHKKPPKLILSDDGAAQGHPDLAVDVRGRAALEDALVGDDGKGKGLGLRAAACELHDLGDGFEGDGALLAALGLVGVVGQRAGEDVEDKPAPVPVLVEAALLCQPALACFALEQDVGRGRGRWRRRGVVLLEDVQDVGPQVDHVHGVGRATVHGVADGLCPQLVGALLGLERVCPRLGLAPRLLLALLRFLALPLQRFLALLLLSLSALLLLLGQPQGLAALLAVRRLGLERVAHRLLQAELLRQHRRQQHVLDANVVRQTRGRRGRLHLGRDAVIADAVAVDGGVVAVAAGGGVDVVGGVVHQGSDKARAGEGGELLRGGCHVGDCHGRADGGQRG